MICAYLLDSQGGGREIEWDAVRSWPADSGWLWVHLDHTVASVQSWLRDEARIEPFVCEALLAEETRPRSLVVGEGLLVILRGVNLNPGADPEDMVSIRLWIDSHRVISLRFRHLMAVEDVRAAICGGAGPHTPGAFLTTIADRLIDRMSPVIDTLEDEVDELEENMLESPHHEVQSTLAQLRRRAIMLRRYLAPQREVMARLSGTQLPWLHESNRAHLREVADRVTRYVEDLDAARERATVTQEELASRLSQRMNQTMYVLSLITAVFLPLGLLTGLLGINVGGIPGSNNRAAFIVVCLLLSAVAVVEIWLFRRRHWL